MPRRTNEFQQLIAAIQTHLDPGAAVEESVLLDDPITNSQREVDVCIRGRVGGQPVLIAVECIGRGRAASVEWVDAMHSKHSSLPTDVLVLVSRSGFSAQAIRKAEAHKIRCVALNYVEPDSPNRLFPELQSLWGKTWTLAIDRVSITVEAIDGLPTETILANPDTALFLESGTALGSAAEMAAAFINHQPVHTQLGSQIIPEHKFIELGWDRPAHAGMRICLQKLHPSVLRPVKQFRVIAKCSVTGQ